MAGQHPPRQQHWEQVFAVANPWNYTAAYEQEKYARQLVMLPPRPIRAALELACAEGQFSVLLAPHVEHLLATDISTNALARAKTRAAGIPNLTFAQLDFGTNPLPANQDLICCAEVLYYLADQAELRRTATRLAAALAPGGSLITAHGFVITDDMRRTGFDWDTKFGAEFIAQVLQATPGLALAQSLQTELYRIDRFHRTDSPSHPPPPNFAPITAPLPPAVAAQVLWGGATTLRRNIGHERRPTIPCLRFPAIAATASHPGLPAATFESQIRWLRANGFHTLSHAAVAEHRRRQTPFEGRPILLGFTNPTPATTAIALPILTRHDLAPDLATAPPDLPCTTIHPTTDLPAFIALFKTHGLGHARP